MLYYPIDPDKVPREEPFVAAEFRSGENWGPETVPEGYYFVLADRRDGASDSRHWKYVPRKYIVGRIALRWWPVSQAEHFYGRMEER